MDDSLYRLCPLLRRIKTIFLKCLKLFYFDGTLRRRVLFLLRSPVPYQIRMLQLLGPNRRYKARAQLSFNCVEIRLSPLTEFELWLGLFKYASPNPFMSAISLLLNYSVCSGIFSLVLLILRIYYLLEFCPQTKLPEVAPLLFCEHAHFVPDENLSSAGRFGFQLR